MESGICLAIAARMGVRATTSYSGPAGSGRTGLSAGATAAAAGATTAPALVAASTSRRMIRPPGPVPWISRRSSPAWAATFRASGETRRRSATGAAVPATAGALTTGAGAATGATLFGAGAAVAGETAGAALAAGLGPPARASTDAMSSPGSAMTPISVPTGARSPAGTRIFRRTPAPKASISTSALSVSISATMSPLWTRSPSFRSHLMTLPVSMASESLGITTLVTAMSLAPVRVRVSVGPVGVGARHVGQRPFAEQTLRIASAMRSFEGVLARSRFRA